MIDAPIIARREGMRKWHLASGLGPVRARLPPGRAQGPVAPPATQARHSAIRWSNPLP